MSVDQFRQQLEKKSTFEKGLNSLISEVASRAGASLDVSVWSAVTRCHTLLKARYTGINFWKLGLRFYQTCQCLQLDSSQASALQQYVKEARSFLNEEDMEDAAPLHDQQEASRASGQQGPATSAVELQRMLLDLYARQAQHRPSHLSDAGLILDDSPTPHLSDDLAAAVAALQAALGRAQAPTPPADASNPTHTTQTPRNPTPTPHSEALSSSNQGPHPSRQQHASSATPPNNSSSNTDPSAVPVVGSNETSTTGTDPSTARLLGSSNVASTMGATASNTATTSSPTSNHTTSTSEARQTHSATNPSLDRSSDDADGVGEVATIGSSVLQRLQLTEENSALQRSILEGIQAVYSGMEAVAMGTQAVEAELDSLLLSVLAREGEQRPVGPPPASKKLVASLPRLVVTEQLLESWGRDTRCPVCTEHLQLQDTVVQLPCRHTYHPDCLQPWLNQHNSCPTCRHELPTDDPVYEARKEREAEEAEERRGAENALSHNEFMYI